MPFAKVIHIFKALRLLGGMGDLLPHISYLGVKGAPSPLSLFFFVPFFAFAEFMSTDATNLSQLNNKAGSILFYVTDIHGYMYDWNNAMLNLETYLTSIQGDIASVAGDASVIRNDTTAIRTYVQSIDSSVSGFGSKLDSISQVLADNGKIKGYYRSANTGISGLSLPNSQVNNFGNYFQNDEKLQIELLKSLKSNTNTVLSAVEGLSLKQDAILRALVATNTAIREMYGMSLKLDTMISKLGQLVENSSGGGSSPGEIVVPAPVVNVSITNNVSPTPVQVLVTNFNYVALYSTNSPVGMSVPMEIVTNFYLSSMFNPYYSTGDYYDWLEYNTEDPDDLWNNAAPYIWNWFHAFLPVANDLAYEFLPYSYGPAIGSKKVRYMTFDEGWGDFELLSRAHFMLYGTAPIVTNTLAIYNEISNLRQDSQQFGQATVEQLQLANEYLFQLTLNLTNSFLSPVSISNGTMIVNKEIVSNAVEDVEGLSLTAGFDADALNTNAIVEVEDSSLQGILNTISSLGLTFAEAEAVQSLIGSVSDPIQEVADAVSSANDHFQVEARPSFFNVHSSFHIDVTDAIAETNVVQKLAPVFKFACWVLKAIILAAGIWKLLDTLLSARS